tara:strand:+ start:4130 stop:5404 length:1275 start_codon:yes stop_codon:yes gene_type:complete
MSADIQLSTPSGYRALDVTSVCTYLAGVQDVAEKLGGEFTLWSAEEVGDGNLNLVFIVRGETGAVCVKQALPYVRLVGESWPLPLTRAHFEHMALVEQTAHAGEYVPDLYHYDEPMALTVMEFLSPHIILRKGLIAGVKYPKMAQDLGLFLARTLFRTSDLYLSSDRKKYKTEMFLPNTAMCQISEDLLFDEPYFDAEMNRHTSPQLDDIADSYKADVDLKLAVQEMKWRFQNAPEALLHADFHTGSVMVTEDQTRVIDPEFAFYGPMGFDVGAIIANLFLAYYSQSAHEGRGDYATWILEQIETLHACFEREFTALFEGTLNGTVDQIGDIYMPRVIKFSPDLKERAIKARLEAIWLDTLGFAGVKMIRRILGLAHVEDFESIENADVRAACERKALIFGRMLLTQRTDFKTIEDVTAAAKDV